MLGRMVGQQKTSYARGAKAATSDVKCPREAQGHFHCNTLKRKCATIVSHIYSGRFQQKRIWRGPSGTTGNQGKKFGLFPKLRV